MSSADSSSTGQDCLLIFARYPQPGQVKTRLIPALGPVAASDLYRRLAEHTLAQGRALSRYRPLSITLWFTGADAAAMTAWLGANIDYCLQPEGDLGYRLHWAFEAAFAQGYRRVIAIGTDCPQLDSSLLNQGFRALDHHELVLGPATDGGYYLIGLQRAVAALFQGIPWSTAAVHQQTVAAAEQLGLSHWQLRSLTDVDTPEDLDICNQILSTPSP
ncbi:2-phospho-L-lactate guanylyltransferase [Halomicronema hongdechloris C2206]|uniref:2-phospho-L-lactate guanylyltransferase n=1 Tax=Halomicronema hongdechloris C2206 TaxID=1641165 RepID=A0A1Z3HJE1_9CYAN|nr:TIGR04282 family arsenosugar biosynthesis glycosyltransferase [Halomicronema hongdechloris]ASC70418.1 2-phospho-L-lactate guanylyltransferase [Halomicronema hongdechloris C2206]